MIYNFISSLLKFLECVIFELDFESDGSKNNLLDSFENIINLSKLYGTSESEGMTQLQSYKLTILAWWAGSRGDLELVPSAIKRVNIKVSRSHLKIYDGALQITSPDAIRLYARVREPGSKNAQYIKICNLSAQEGIDELVSRTLADISSRKENKTLKTENHQMHFKTHKLQHGSQVAMPTLFEYLPKYIQHLETANPLTAKSKVNIIAKHFSHLYHVRVDQITGDHLFDWLGSHKIERSPKEINSGLSQYNLANSTIKGAISTLRAMIKCASEEDAHPFTPSPSLWSKKYKIAVHNQCDRYYSDEELQDIFTKLNQRDMDKKRATNVACRYGDFLTPLVWLCLMTGLRPRYALKIRKCDINWNTGVIIIKGDMGKISEDRTIEISSGLKKVLLHWLMHPVYHGKESDWLFPNFRQPQFSLQDYKSAVNELKAEYRVQELDFRIIRHTFATIFTAQTKNIYMTQKALHHANIQTTERYVHLLTGEKKQAIEDLADRITKLQALSKQEPWQPPEDDDDLAS